MLNDYDMVDVSDRMEKDGGVECTGCAFSMSTFAMCPLLSLKDMPVGKECIGRDDGKIFIFVKRDAK